MNNQCVMKNIKDDILKFMNIKKNIFKLLNIKKITPLSKIIIYSTKLINNDICYEEKNIIYNHFTNNDLLIDCLENFTPNLIVLRIINMKYGIVNDYNIIYYMKDNNIIYDKNNIKLYKDHHIFDISMYDNDVYDSDNNYTKIHSFKVYFRYTLSFLNIL